MESHSKFCWRQILRAFENILETFHRNQAADQRDIDNLRTFTKSELPSDYIEFLKFSNGASGWLNEHYLVVYSIEEVINVNRIADTSRYCPGRLIFASNRGGTSYLLKLASLPSVPVFRCEDVDLSYESSIEITSSMDKFFQNYGPDVA